MLKKISIYFFLIFFPSVLFANFCSDFESYLKNRINTNEFLEIKNSWNSFGFGLMQDINKDSLYKVITEEAYTAPYIRDIDNYLIIQSVVDDGPFDKAGIRHFDRLVKINDQEVSEMTDEVFDLMFDGWADDEIKFTFQLFEKDFGTKDYYIRSDYAETSGIVDIKISPEELEWPNDVYSILIPIDLIEVRPEKYELDLEYITQINYFDFQSSEFVEQYGFFEEELCIYNLSPNENVFEKYNLFNPMIIKEGLIEDKSTSQNILQFDIYQNTDGRPLIWTSIKERKVSTFSQYFDFYLFPFEKHSIDIDLKPYYTNNFYTNNINQYADDAVWYADRLADSMFTANFEIIESDYTIYTDDDFDESILIETVVTWIDIERRSFYFVAKIVAPIFLILLLSWSVFFLKPRDIESRLTVSIICFLSLIAYNFVIEDSIPKLNYYTWMDWYVSFSYIFCGLTTFFTIYDYQLINKNKKQFKVTEAMRSSGIFVFIMINIISFYLLKFEYQGYF